MIVSARLSSRIRPALLQLSQKRASRGLRSSSTTKLSARDQPFFEQGYLDERGLTRFETLHELQVRSCAVFRDNPLFGTYDPATESFEFETYGDFEQQVHTSRRVLQHLGVSPFDKIALIANNRWEWAALTTAAHSLRASVVPLYEAQRPADWTYIVGDATPKVLVCATQSIYDRVMDKVKPNAPLSLQSILCLDAPVGEPHSFQTLFQQQQQENTIITMDGIVPPTPDDLASLIYTSGTTGNPKGVELLHANICSNIEGARRTVHHPRAFFRESDTTLAFLPWAHSFGQTVDLWTPLAHGTSMALSRGFAHVAEELPLVKPTALASVPLLFKKVHDGVQNVVETSNPRRKYLMQTALALGSKQAQYDSGVGPPLNWMERLQYSVLDALVLSKIRDRLGGNLRCKCVCLCW